MRGGGPALALAVVALALAGCRGESGVKLQVWALGREGEVLAELMPAFEARHPGVKVDVQQTPWTAAHEKLLSAVVGDATPDVAQIGNTWVPELETIHALLPLDERVAASATVAEADYFPGVWRSNQVDGRLWGLPWYVDTRLLFYRQDLLAAAGVTAMPRSWEEWRQALRQLRALPAPPGSGFDQRYAILLPTDEWEQPVIFGLQAGSTLLRDGNRYGDFRGEAFRRGLDFYLSLYREGLAPLASLNQIANVYQQIGRGEVALYISGPWNLGEFRRRLPAELASSWATAPLPAPAAAGWPGTSLAGGSSLVIFRRSRHPEAAWQLLEYLAEPAQQLRFYALCGDLPPRRSVWASPELAGDAAAQAFFAQLQRVQPTPAVPEWEQIAKLVAERVDAAIRGVRTAEETVVGLDAEVDRILAKRRAVLARQAEGG